jgi:DNA-binding transcriptional regulator LsrR (DeoR family)
MIKKQSLKNEALNNVREDRLVLKKFILSLTECLLQARDKEEEKLIHDRLGEVAAKYLQASVKNNEQMVAILKMEDKKEQDEEITKKDIEEVYNSIEDKE